MALPEAHRRLLEQVGASQWKIVEEPLGRPLHNLLRSAGLGGLTEQQSSALALAVAVWVDDLRVVLFNARHPLLARLDGRAWEHALVSTAWHEWGHALSIARCTPDDVAAGRRLLELAPTTVSDSIRHAGYGPSEYTHELVANVYALMIERHQRGELGTPSWLHNEIYDLVKRVTGWSE